MAVSDGARTPDFLIVGAMKAGTTTLHRDLSQHPDVFLSVPKEPEVLIRYDKREEMLSDYAFLFKRARRGQKLGEASTAYTKRPTHEGVAEKAKALCGSQLKIIYIRREPIDRILSQYEHESQFGLIDGSLEEALRTHSRLIDYSRYEWQIAPWLAAFGEENVLQLTLEDYSARRFETLDRVLCFLELDPSRLPAIDTTTAYNRRDQQKSVDNPLLRSLIYSSFYQRNLKPLIPERLRRRVREAILPAPAISPRCIDPALSGYIESRLNQPPPAALATSGAPGVPHANG